MSSGDMRILDQTIAFPFGSASRPAYFARPDGDGPFPGVVVIHEIYGLNDNIRDIARRFARQGYAALAVDLLGGRNRTLCMLRLLGTQLVAPLNNGGISELKAALSYLGGLAEVDSERLGAVGFCMGGGFAIAWACTDPRLKAIAPFYGSNPRPLRAVARACPVVGSYPERDFTAGMGRKLDAKLAEYGIPHSIKVYPGARHSFFNDQGRAYDASAATDSWQRLLSFFAERIG